MPSLCLLGLCTFSHIGASSVPDSSCGLVGDGGAPSPSLAQQGSARWAKSRREQAESCRERAETRHNTERWVLGAARLSHKARRPRSLLSRRPGRRLPKQAKHRQSESGVLAHSHSLMYCHTKFQRYWYIGLGTLPLPSLCSSYATPPPHLLALLCLPVGASLYFFFSWCVFDCHGPSRVRHRLATKTKLVAPDHSAPRRPFLRSASPTCSLSGPRGTFSAMRAPCSPSCSNGGLRRRLYFSVLTHVVVLLYVAMCFRATPMAYFAMRRVDYTLWQQLIALPAHLLSSCTTSQELRELCCLSPALALLRTMSINKSWPWRWSQCRASC